MLLLKPKKKKKRAVEVFCSLQDFGVASGKRGGEERAFPRQSQQPGTQRGGGGFPETALQTSQLRGRVKPAAESAPWREPQLPNDLKPQKKMCTER